MKIKEKTKRSLKDMAGFTLGMIMFYSIVGTILMFFIIIMGIITRVGITLPKYLVVISFYMTAIAALAIAWAVCKTISRTPNLLEDQKLSKPRTRTVKIPRNLMVPK